MRYAVCSHNIKCSRVCAIRYTRSVRHSRVLCCSRRNTQSDQNMSGSLLDICLLFFVCPTTCGPHVVSLFMLSLHDFDSLSVLLPRSFSFILSICGLLSFVTFHSLSLSRSISISFALSFAPFCSHCIQFSSLSSLA